MKFSEVQKLAARDPKFKRAIEASADRVKRQLRTAKRKFREFHWQDEPEQIQRVNVPTIQAGDSLYSLGELISVTYRASKANEVFDWHHEFEQSRPELAATTSGDLVIVGGNYRIEERGIVG